MMKKMLILTLVLGMASVASAGIVVVSPDGVSGSIQTDPIGEVVDQQALFMAIAGPGSISNETMMYAGSLATINDYTGLDPGLTGAVDAAISAYAAGDPLLNDGGSTKILYIEYFDGTTSPPDVSGVLTTFDVTGVVEAYLIDPDITGAFSAVVIPEPITLSLLGLGGLFLRRRK